MVEKWLEVSCFQEIVVLIIDYMSTRTYSILYIIILQNLLGFYLLELL